MFKFPGASTTLSGLIPFKTSSENVSFSSNLFSSFYLVPVVSGISILFYNFAVIDKWHARICWENSKSFFFASLFYPANIRNRIFVLYSFAREADDLIDEYEGREQEENKKALELFISNIYTRNAVEDSKKQGFDLFPCTEKWQKGLLSDKRKKIFTDFAALVYECSIPKWSLLLLLNGFEHDAVTNEISQEEDLIDYCIGVASSIGIVCTYLYGGNVSCETLEKASSLGIAMQLTNISRDIITDAKIGRTYIPNSWFAQAKITRNSFMSQALTDFEDKRPSNDASLVKSLADDLVGKAESYYADAWEGISFLPTSVRLAVASALLIYREIGTRIIISTTYPERSRIGGWEKLYLSAKAFGYLITNRKPTFFSKTPMSASADLKRNVNRVKSSV